MIIFSIALLGLLVIVAIMDVIFFVSIDVDNIDLACIIGVIIIILSVVGITMNVVWCWMYLEASGVLA